MANRKKRMVPIGFEPEDDLFIREHTARVGGTYQNFVSVAVKKEIKTLQKIKAAKETRTQKNLENKSK